MFANPNFLSVLLFFIGCALQLGDVHSKELGYVLWAVALGMVIYAGVQWSRLPVHFRRKLDSLRVMRFGGRISLREAAQIIYEDARATGSVWAHAAERMGVDKSPDGILDYISMVMAQDTEFWGKRPPSNLLERLDPLQLKYCTVTGGGRELRVRDKANTVFTDLVVQTKDLRRALEEVRVGLKTDTKI